MSLPRAFEVIYPDMVGPAYPATPASIRNVLATMNAAAGHPWNSIRVRFLYPDGSAVVASPKRRLT